VPPPPADGGRAIAGRLRAIAAVGSGERDTGGPERDLDAAGAGLPDALALDLGDLDPFGGTRGAGGGIFDACGRRVRRGRRTTGGKAGDKRQQEEEQG